MRLSIVFPTFLIIALAGGVSYGAAWVQKKHHGQIILTGNYTTANRFYDAEGNTQRQTQYVKYELNPYFEYGLSDRITLGANLFLQRSAQGINASWGMGDSEFFARVHLAQIHGFVISLQPLVKLPSPTSETQQPLIGSHDPDAELTLSVGRGFSLFGRDHFANLDLGYRHRFGAPKDQYRIAATVGMNVSERLTLMPQLFVTRSTDIARNAAFTQSSGDDYHLTKLQLSAVYRINSRLNAQAGYFTTLDGKNTGDGQGVILSLWRQF